MRLSIFTLAGTVLLCVSACAQEPSDDQPAIAYGNAGTLYIATTSGKTLSVWKPTPPIGTFAFTTDAKQVLFAPLGKYPHDYGGQLYVLTLSTNKVKRLTHGPYYNKSGKSDEVYADPDVAPDDKRAVFAIHESSGDLVEASGPFAVITLSTGNVSLAESSLHTDVNGVAFANDPHWSPDGRHILLNYEDGVVLSDPSGKNSQNLSPLIGNGGWSHAERIIRRRRINLLGT
jgi:hypothetical protein